MKYPVQMRLRSVLILGIVWAAMPGPSPACNVPVFRYAMERWTADPYQLVVYHEGGGPALKLLEKNGIANYSLTPVDVATPEGKAAAGRRGITAFPWIEVFYPLNSQIRTPVWSGPLTAERVRKILESPARSRLAQRLLGGEIAVWVLVKSGHAEKDRRALESLRTHLKRASDTLRIPETGIDANGNPVEVADFKTYPVRFGLMEIARHAPEDELLVSALLKSEADLEHYDEPMAFPVFGRGRALYALVGDGIQEKNILDACKAMLAWCSCEIKSLNPGTDLLIAADWSRPAGGRMVKDPELPLTGLTSALQAAKPKEPAAAPEPPAGPTLCTLPAAPRPPAQTPPPAASPLVRNVLYLAAAAGVVLLALSVFLTVKARR